MNASFRQLIRIATKITLQLQDIAGHLKLKNEEDAKTRKDEANKRGQGSDVSLPPTVIEVKSLPSLPQDEITYQKKKRSRESIQFHIAWGTLVLLAVYTGTVIYQACLTQQAIADSEESFKRTFCQMKAQTQAQVDAAKAAQDAANVSRESLTSVQRAFVSFAGGGSAKKVIVRGKVTDLVVTLPWVNYGVTPTRNGKSQINWEPFPGDLPNNFDFPDIGKVKFSQFMIPAKGSGNATMKIPIDIFSEIKKGNMRLFVWGWITYHDIFNKTPTHLSEFCDEVTKITTSSEDVTNSTTDVTWELNLCQTHNCADEECGDYKQKTKGK
jgi:hypothetical protein